MDVLVPVNVADLLCRAGHLAVAGKVVEEHEATVKIDALQNEVGHHHAQQRRGVLLLLELVVAVPDEGVAPQKVLVGLPLVEDVVALHGGANGVQHIAIALGVDALLKRLNGQAEIDLVGGNIRADVGQIRRLDGVQKDEKA